MVGVLAGILLGGCVDGAQVAWQIDRARFEKLIPDQTPDAALKRAWMANRMQAPPEAQSELARYREMGRRDIERAATAFFDDAAVQQLLVDYRTRAGDIRGAADAVCRFAEANETFSGHVTCGDARRNAGQSKAALESFRHAYGKAASRDEQFAAIGRVETNAASADLSWVDARVMRDYRAAQQNAELERQRQAALAYQQAQYQAYEAAERARVQEQLRLQQQAAQQQQQQHLMMMQQGRRSGGWDRDSCKSECRADESECQNLPGSDWGACMRQRSACDSWCWDRWR